MTFSLRRFGTRTTCIALAAVVLTGAARVGVGRYLTSSHGKTMVADRIGTALGMPVEVSEVEVGDSASSFRFRVMDPADPKAEVLTVHSASADVTASDFMTGRVAPIGPEPEWAQRLRCASAPAAGYSRRSRRLPGTRTAVPTVAIDNGRVSVRQEGRPEFAVSGVSLKLEPAARTVALSGSVTDPKWGVWTVRGELQRDTRSGWVELVNADAPLDAELLATVPFAPPELFNDIPTNTRAAVTVRLTIGPDHDVQPAVEIRYTHKVFGFPVTNTFRLTPGSDRYYFEALR